MVVVVLVTAGFLYLWLLCISGYSVLLSLCSSVFLLVCISTRLYFSFSVRLFLKTNRSRSNRQKAWARSIRAIHSTP